MKNCFLLFICFLVHNITFASTDIDSLLVVLEHSMENHKQFDLKKQQRIKQLKEFLTEPNNTLEQTYSINRQLIKEYIPYNFNSALHFIELNLAIAKKASNQTWKNESNLQLSRILSTSGNYKEAVDILELIPRKTLSGKALDDYYYNLMKVYWSLYFYTPAKENHTKYKLLYTTYKDSLLRSADKNSDRYLSIIEEQLRDNGQIEASIKVNDQRLAVTQLGTRDYSRITFDRSQSYKQLKNQELQKKFLILSAISDIRGSVKDNASLTALAMILFKENQIDKAHQYINFSFADVVFYNSSFRYGAISNILPIINKVHEINSEKQKNKLHWYLYTISLLTFILLLTVIYIYRQLKNLSRARKELQELNNQLKIVNESLINANQKLTGLYGELSESNHIKEYYIGNFLSICSNYIEKLDMHRKMVKKMIVAKQFVELFEKTKSSQLIDEELELFYKNFDATFLNIYPDFVKQLNDLLLPEERIILKKGDLLNTELRIFALIRLGISDSANIAKLLRYSVNTIYNYRVKIKNKAAVPRDDFEKLILNIGSFTK
jgi:DNA-binding CsgD family transcriptional regulator